MDDAGQHLVNQLLPQLVNPILGIMLGFWVIEKILSIILQGVALMDRTGQLRTLDDSEIQLLVSRAINAEVKDRLAYLREKDETHKRYGYEKSLSFLAYRWVRSKLLPNEQTQPSP